METSTIQYTEPSVRWNRAGSIRLCLLSELHGGMSRISTEFRQYRQHLLIYRDNVKSDSATFLSSAGLLCLFGTFFSTIKGQSCRKGRDVVM
jgi:hypothetical protein